MAQRTSTSRKTDITLGWIKTRRKRVQPPINDNEQIPSSGLRFREQKYRCKRAVDLSWQVKFASMKLHHWRDIDNGAWGPLDKFLKVAQTQLTELGPV